jgi:hypothetical protein
MMGHQRKEIAVFATKCKSTHFCIGISFETKVPFVEYMFSYSILSVKISFLSYVSDADTCAPVSNVLMNCNGVTENVQYVELQ